MDERAGYMACGALVAILVVLEIGSVIMMWMGDDWLAASMHAVLAVVFVLLGAVAIRKIKSS